jgi:hypothetical protein
VKLRANRKRSIKYLRQLSKRVLIAITAFKLGDELISK